MRPAPSVRLAALTLVALLSLGCDPDIRNLKLEENERLSRPLIPLLIAAYGLLLTVVWQGSNVGCLATADLYEDIARDRSRWGRWLSRHPFPERRVEAIVQACEAAQRQPPR